MLILAFTCDAVPNLLRRFLKLSSLHNHTGNFSLKTSWQGQIHNWLTRYSGLFIFPIYLSGYIIRDHTGNCFRKMSWPGADYISDSEAGQKTILLWKTKIKDRQKAFLNEHKNFKWKLTIKPLFCYEVDFRLDISSTKSAAQVMF